MKRSCTSVALLVVLGAAHNAAAQAPGQVPPPAPAAGPAAPAGPADPALAPFLEKRIPEEMATEGVVLSRRNLGLQIEQLGGKWLVSLVDLATGRVAASTKVDALPADREAAVAAMTHIVSELASQIVGRAEPAPAPAPAAPPAAGGLIDDRTERAERDRAELTFRRRALHFGEQYHLIATPNAVGLQRRWIVYQGDLDQELEPLEFYATVGRADLAQAYDHRRNVKIGSYVVAGVAYAAALVFLYEMIPGNSGTCDASLPYDQFSACLDKDTKDDHDRLTTYGPLAVGFTLGASVAFIVGMYYSYHPHPITENEAKTLADAYNQQLRRGLSLPVVARREPLLRDLQLAPYAGGNAGAGLALSARF